MAEKSKTEKISLNFIEHGRTGIERYAGMFNEEYLTALTGTDAADIYDQMRRSDGQVAQALTAIKNTISGAKWFFQPVDDSDQEREIADFLEFVFFEDLDKSWKRKMNEFLTLITFGHSVFEVVHKVVAGHKKWGDYVGFKKIAFRSQKTLERWNFVKGDFDNIEQQVYGDEGAIYTLPAKNLLIMSVDDEGDNLEGISMLRACYGSWFRKNMYLRLQAVGSEKSLAIPIGRYPYGQYNTEEFNNFREALMRLVTHEQNHIMLPNDTEKLWDIEFKDINFDPQKLQTLIDYEDSLMMRRFIAQFLLLGQQGSSGSWALSNDQSDFFLNSLVYIADIVREQINKLARNIVIYKFGQRDYYPELKHAGIKDKAGKELAEILQILTGSGVVKPDKSLEDFVRIGYNLPEKDEEEEEEVIEPIPPKEEKQPDVEEPEEAEEAEEAEVEKEMSDKRQTIKLAAPRKQIDALAKEIENVMRSNLNSMSKDYIGRIVKTYKNATPLKKVDAATDNEVKGVTKYAKELRDVLVNGSIEARREAMKSFKFAKDDIDPFMNKYLAAYSKLVARQHALDTEKAVTFKFGNVSSYSQDPLVIEQELTKEAEKLANKSIESGKGTIASTTVNKTRINFFFDKEMKEEVESFTFVNPDPKSSICQYLAGKTVSINDKEALEYTPPLHHNCKTYMEVNLRAAKNNPEAQKIAPNEQQIKSKSLMEVV